MTVRGRGKKGTGGRGKGGPRVATTPMTPQTSPLPQQYSFTPAPETSPPPPLNLHQTQLHVRHFPPPNHLFQTPNSAPGPSTTPQVSTGQTLQPHTSPTPQPQINHRRSSSNPSEMSQQTRFSPLHNSETQSNQGFDAQQSNECEDNGADEIDDNERIEPNLPEDQLRFLERQLMMPNRDKFTTVLSPLLPQPPNTTW